MGNIRIIRRKIGKITMVTPEGPKELDVYYPSPGALAALRSLGPLFEKMEKEIDLDIEELEKLNKYGAYIAKDVLKADHVELEGDSLTDLLLSIYNGIAPLAEEKVAKLQEKLEQVQEEQTSGS